MYIGHYYLQMQLLFTEELVFTWRSRSRRIIYIGIYYFQKKFSDDLVLVERQVIAQVVEAQLRICHVSDVLGIIFAPLCRLHVGLKAEFLKSERPGLICLCQLE